MLRRDEAIETLRIVGGLRMGEGKLAGADGRFRGETDWRPVSQRRAEVRGRQHREHGIGDIRETELDGTVAEVRDRFDLSRTGGMVNTFHGSDVHVRADDARITALIGSQAGGEGRNRSVHRLFTVTFQA